MDHVLLIGAFANTGRYICEHFLSQGVDVSGFDLKNKKNIDLLEKLNKKVFKGKYTNFWGDLTDINSIHSIFDILHHKSMNRRVDAVVHVAFIIPPFSELKPDMATAVNVGGTSNLVEVIEKREPKARLLFTSSVATFGFSEFDAPEVTVDTPLSGINHYAQNKIDAEKIVKSSKLDWTIFKLSAVMIPDAEITEESKEYSKSIHPDSRIEPVHVRDIATAVFNALSTDVTIFGQYIIAGGKNNQTTYGEYISQTLNCFVPLKYDDIPWDQFDPEKYYLHIYDTKHSQDVLNYQTRSIEQYLKEFKKNVPLWQRVFAFFMKKRVIRDTFHLKNGDSRPSSTLIKKLDI